MQTEDFPPILSRRNLAIWMQQMVHRGRSVHSIEQDTRGAPCNYCSSIPCSLWERGLGIWVPLFHNYTWLMPLLLFYLLQADGSLILWKIYYSRGNWRSNYRCKICYRWDLAPSTLNAEHHKREKLVPATTKTPSLCLLLTKSIEQALFTPVNEYNVAHQFSNLLEVEETHQ